MSGLPLSSSDDSQQFTGASALSQSTNLASALCDSCCLKSFLIPLQPKLIPQFSVAHVKLDWFYLEHFPTLQCIALLELRFPTQEWPQWVVAQAPNLAPVLVLFICSAAHEWTSRLPSLFVSFSAAAAVCWSPPGPFKALQGPWQPWPRWRGAWKTWVSLVSFKCRSLCLLSTFLLESFQQALVAAILWANLNLNGKRVTDIMSGCSPIKKNNFSFNTHP